MKLNSYSGVRESPDKQPGTSGAGEKELIFNLIRAGIANQRKNLHNYTDTNENSAVKAAGKESISGILEFLTKNKIVSDFQPTFSRKVHGFAYKINPDLVAELISDELIKDKISELFELRNGITASLDELTDKLGILELNVLYKDELIKSLEELKICYNIGCYTACLALCEKIWYIALLKMIDDKKSTMDYSWISKDPKYIKYFDQPLTERGFIIDKNRAIARKKKNPLPSMNNAAMEIHAVIDTLNNIIQ